MHRTNKVGCMEDSFSPDFIGTFAHKAHNERCKKKKKLANIFIDKNGNNLPKKQQNSLEILDLKRKKNKRSKSLIEIEEAYILW